MPKKSATFSPQTLIAYIQQNPQPIARRDIAQAFHIKGNDRITLKMMLKGLVDEGALFKKGKSYSLPSSDLYCEVMVVETTQDGELLAVQQNNTSTDKAPLKFLLSMLDNKISSLAVGERALIRYRLSQNENDVQNGTVIKKLEKSQKKIMGIFQSVGETGTLLPTDRRNRGDYFISSSHINNAQDGDLVEIEILYSRPRGRIDAQVAKVLGPLRELPSPTFIAIHNHDLKTEFSTAALAQAEKATIPSLKGREDLRDIPLVTIDDEDARDFDDAVWARPDPDINNKGGWQLMVAIADVSHYVKPSDDLDKDAYTRGNSTYFPDQVIPMLPENLSNGLCSLRPDEDRACLAVEMIIDHKGKLLSHRFIRGLMRSVARLTYNNVQSAYEGKESTFSPKFIQDVIKPLYGAFKSLKVNREWRGTLELDLPEERIYLTPEGKVAKIVPRERHDSHKLIEEFMILANVAAAITLSDCNIPTLYRIHDEPDQEKVNALGEFLRSLGLPFAKGQVMRPKVFNALLTHASTTPHAHAVHELVLRTQAQAVYSPENIGHFGLSLARYCHFTSPIRRYADLIVHRALTQALQIESELSYPYSLEQLQQIGEYISFTERRSATAERETIERYVAGYLEERKGEVFKCRISGLSDAGLFLTILDNGADGLVPIRTLPTDFYHYDRPNHLLIGRRRRYSFRLGDYVQARLEEANPLTGGLILSLVLDKSEKTKPLDKDQKEKPATKKASVERTQKKPFKKSIKKAM